MATPRIFKLPRHRQFNYQPLYYDAEREERKARNRAIKEELGVKIDGEYKSGITRGSMRHYIKNQKRSSRNSNIRLIVILSILFFFAYILLIR